MPGVVPRSEDLDKSTVHRDVCYYTFPVVRSTSTHIYNFGGINLPSARWCDKVIVGLGYKMLQG